MVILYTSKSTCPIVQGKVQGLPYPCLPYPVIVLPYLVPIPVLPTLSHPYPYPTPSLFLFYPTLHNGKWCQRDVHEKEAITREP